MRRESYSFIRTILDMPDEQKTACPKKTCLSMSLMPLSSPYNGY